MIYENQCGMFAIRVRDPYPAWIELGLAGEDKPYPIFKVDDLRDLRYLLDRAEAAIVAKGVE